LHTKLSQLSAERKGKCLRCLYLNKPPLKIGDKNIHFVELINILTILLFFRTHEEGKEEPDWGDWFMNVPRVSSFLCASGKLIGL
jgi:hypothetical protein